MPTWTPRSVGHGESVCPIFVASFPYCISSVITDQSRTRDASAIRAPVASRKAPARATLLQRDMRRADAAADEEPRSVRVSRLVRSEEESRPSVLTITRKRAAPRTPRRAKSAVGSRLIARAALSDAAYEICDVAISNTHARSAPARGGAPERFAERNRFCG